MPITIIGRKIKFGLLETEDQPVIDALRACAAARVGGVIEITEEEYNDRLKKKSLKTPSTQQRNRESFSKLPQPERLGKRKRNAAFADEDSTYIADNPEVKLSAMPTVGRVKI